MKKKAKKTTRKIKKKISKKAPEKTLKSRRKKPTVKTETRDDGSVFQHAKSILFKKYPTGIVRVMHVENDKQLFSIDGIAAEIWALFNGRRTLGDIKQLIVQKYNPPLSLFTRDVKKFVLRLQREGLISPQ